MRGHSRWSTLVLVSAFVLSILALPPHATAAAVAGGAESQAMAGAYVGVAAGLEGAFWNPAGLAWLKQKELGGAVAGTSGTAMNFFVGYAEPDEGDGAGAIWAVQNVEDVPGSGTHTARSLAYSYARAIQPAIALGATLRVQSEEYVFPGYDLPTATGVRLDAGMHYRLTDRLAVGVAVKDLVGTPLKSSLGEMTDPAPDLAAGVAYRLNDSWLIDADAVDLLGNAPEGSGVRIGVKAQVAPGLSVLGGATSRSGENTWTIGAGYTRGAVRGSIAYCDADGGRASLGVVVQI